MTKSNLDVPKEFHRNSFTFLCTIKMHELKKGNGITRQIDSLLRMKMRHICL